MSGFSLGAVLWYIPTLMQSLGNMWGTDNDFIIFVIFLVCLLYLFIFSITALVVSFRRKPDPAQTAPAYPAAKKKVPAAIKKLPVPVIIVVVAAALVAAAGYGVIAEKAREGGVPKTGQGYDLVKWGSSPEKVRSAYGISDAILPFHQQNDGDSILSLVQENVSGSITKRIFKFDSGKLLAVQVFYAKSVNPDSVKASLTGTYGPATDTRVSEKKTSEPVYEMHMSRGLVKNLDGSMVQGWKPAQLVQTGTKTTVERNYTVTFDQYLPYMYIDFYFGDTWDTRVRYRGGKRPEG
jgi:hypothetical protein